MAKDIVVGELNIEFKENIDQKLPEGMYQFLLTQPLTKDQLESPPVEKFLELTDKRNSGTKTIRISFKFSNMRLNRLKPECQGNQCKYTLLSMTYYAPALLILDKANEFSHQVNASAIEIAERHALSSEVGLCEAECAIYFPAVQNRREKSTMEGEVICEDTDNNIKLYSSPVSIDFEIGTTQAFSSENPHTIEGFYNVEAGYMYAIRGSLWYPFDEYVFEVTWQFPFKIRLINPRIRSEKDANHGLSTKEKDLENISLNPHEKWETKLLFFRKEARLQFYVAVLALILGFAFSFISMMAWRLFFYFIVAAIFLITTRPRLSGLSEFYFARSAVFLCWLLVLLIIELS